MYRRQVAWKKKAPENRSLLKELNLSHFDTGNHFNLQKPKYPHMRFQNRLKSRLVLLPSISLIGLLPSSALPASPANSTNRDPGGGLNGRAAESASFSAIAVVPLMDDPVASASWGP